jgi:acyl carrier protein
MDKKALLLKLDELIEVPPGTLQGHESVKHWDSINVISLIALADEEFNKSLTAKQIAEANTVDDIVNILAE